MYKNYYYCKDCNIAWDDTAESKCDDECPKCETPYTPFKNKKERDKAMKKPRLGRIVFDLGYVVDLNNEDMVEHAKTAVYEDIMSAIKYNEIEANIKVIEDKNAKEEDIPEFLIEDHCND